MEHKLLDLPFHGVNFTWTNNKDGLDTIMERIDRAICNPNWKNDFPDASITNLPILLSNHSRIILQTHPSSTKKRGLTNWTVGAHKKKRSKIKLKIFEMNTF